jgi:hypothetical protein
MTAFPVHDEAHDAFMMLPPYSGTREGMGSSMGGSGPNHGFRAFALMNCSQEEKNHDQA